VDRFTVTFGPAAFLPLLGGGSWLWSLGLLWSRNRVVVALDVVLLVGVPRNVLVGVGEELRCLLQVQVPAVAELRQDKLCAYKTK